MQDFTTKRSLQIIFHYSCEYSGNSVIEGLLVRKQQNRGSIKSTQRNWAILYPFSAFEEWLAPSHTTKNPIFHIKSINAPFEGADR